MTKRFKRGAIYKYENDYFISMGISEGRWQFLRWDSSNASTIVDERREQTCPNCHGHGNYFVETTELEAETEFCTRCSGTGKIGRKSIHELEYVADNMKEFIQKRLMKIFLDG